MTVMMTHGHSLFPVMVRTKQAAQVASPTKAIARPRVDLKTGKAGKKAAAASPVDKEKQKQQQLQKKKKAQDAQGAQDADVAIAARAAKGAKALAAEDRGNGRRLQYVPYDRLKRVIYALGATNTPTTTMHQLEAILLYYFEEHTTGMNRLRRLNGKTKLTLRNARAALEQRGIVVLGPDPPKTKKSKPLAGAAAAAVEASASKAAAEDED